MSNSEDDNWLKSEDDEGWPDPVKLHASLKAAPRTVPVEMPPSLTVPLRNPAASNATGSVVEPRPTTSTETVPAGKPRIVFVLATVLGIQTLLGLGYFLFRPRSSPAIYRISNSDLPTTTSSSGSLAQRVSATPGDSAVGREIVVSSKGDGQTATIGDAIRQAIPGSRIVIRPGRYREKLVLDKPLEIVGEGGRGDVIIESGSGTVLVLRADRASIRGLTVLRSEGIEEQDSYAVEIPQGELIIEDCDITSQASDCLVVKGHNSSAIVRRCRIRDGRKVGARFEDGSRGTLDDCELTGNGEGGVVISEGADPLVRNCQISRGKKGAGVLVNAGGNGRFLDCKMEETAGNNVVLRTGARPTFRKCLIRAAAEMGIAIAEETGGLFIDCDIIENSKVGVLLKDGAQPHFVHCRITQNKNSALWADGGGGTFHDCEFAGSEKTVVINGKSNPQIVASRLHDASDCAVLVTDGGSGTFEDCEIHKAGLDGIRLSRDSTPFFRNCKIHDNVEIGLNATENARGEFENCVFRANGKQSLHLQSGTLTTFRRCSFLEADDGILVSTLADPLFDDCDIGGNKGNGVSIERDGKGRFSKCRIVRNGGMGILVFGNSGGLFTGCEISESKGPNVMVTDEGTPAFHGCRIHSGKQQGVVARGKSTPTWERCEFDSNEGNNFIAAEEAQVILTRCRIHKSKQAGCGILMSAKGQLIECEIFDNQKAGGIVQAKAQLVVRGGSIHGGKDFGLIATDEGHVTVSDAEIFGNTGAEVVVAKSARGVLALCRISKGSGAGIVIQSSANSFVDNCEIFETGTDAVLISGSGTTTFRDCNLHHAKQAGVKLTNGAALFQDCTTAGNASAGMTVEAGGQLTVIGGTVKENGTTGLMIGKGRLFLTRCRIEGHRAQGIEVRGEGVLSADQAVFASNEIGIFVQAHGQAQLAGCIATERTRQAWKVERDGKLSGTGNTPPLP